MELLFDKLSNYQSDEDSDDNCFILEDSESDEEQGQGYTESNNVIAFKVRIMINLNEYVHLTLFTLNHSYDILVIPYSCWSIANTSGLCSLILKLAFSKHIVSL